MAIFNQSCKFISCRYASWVTLALETMRFSLCAMSEVFFLKSAAALWALERKLALRCHDLAWLWSCSVFWVVGWAEQASQNTGVESGCCLLPHLSFIYSHQDSFLKSRRSTGLSQIVKPFPVVIRPGSVLLWVPVNNLCIFLHSLCFPELFFLQTQFSGSWDRYLLDLSLLFPAWTHSLTSHHPPEEFTHLFSSACSPSYNSGFISQSADLCFTPPVDVFPAKL